MSEKIFRQYDHLPVPAPTKQPAILFWCITYEMYGLPSPVQVDLISEG